MAGSWYVGLHAPWMFVQADMTQLAEGKSLGKHAFRGTAAIGNPMIGTGWWGFILFQFELRRQPTKTNKFCRPDIGCGGVLNDQRPLRVSKVLNSSIG